LRIANSRADIFEAANVFVDNMHSFSDDLTPHESTLLSNDTWSISGIVLREIVKLARTLSRIQTWPLTLDICRAINTLDFDSDPADEIIAATSIVHRLPLVTRDRRMRRSKRISFAV
jgi:rRNA-processing protein FCF1